LINHEDDSEIWETGAVRLKNDSLEGSPLRKVPGHFSVRDVICKESNSILITSKYIHGTIHTVENNRLFFRRYPKSSKNELYKDEIELSGCIFSSILARQHMNVVYDSDSIWIYFTEGIDIIRRSFTFIYKVFPANGRVTPFSDIVVHNKVK
jgi:hypothetical protein